MASTDTVPLASVTLNLAAICAERLLPAERVSVLALGVGPSPGGDASVVVCRSDDHAVGLAVDARRYPEIREAIDTQAMVVVADVLEDDRFAALRDGLPAHVRSVLALPIEDRGELVGVLHVRCSSPLAVDHVTRVTLREIGRAAGRALAAQARDAKPDAAKVGRRAPAAPRDDSPALNAHDFRGHVNVISMQADLLLAGSRGELTERQRASVEKIRLQVRSLIDLLDAIVAAHDHGADSLEISPRPGDLGASLRQCADEVSVAFQDRGISLRVQVVPTLPAVVFDAVQIRRVMANLLVNALKFTPAGGAVAIEAVAQDQQAVVSVTDSGPGIDAADLADIFEPYRRGRNAGQSGGVGLGLAICREVVERHGGRIWAAREVGRGATFHFTLPLAESEVASRGPETATPARARRIVIVDDDPGTLRTLASPLEHEGYVVRTLEEGAAALREIRRDPPDLALIDVHLPGFDGFSVAERLKRDARTAHVPFLFLSAWKGVEHRVRGFQLGGEDFLVKPIDGSELLVRVKHSLEVAAQRQRAVAEADVDALTGIGNPHAFSARLHEELARARRYRHPLALAVLDVDRFRLLNDELGHDVGDLVLKHLGKVLRASVRPSDTVARYGGDEFVALLPHTGGKDALRFVERIRGEFKVGLPEGTGRCTLSVGVATLCPGGDAIPPEHELIRRANIALLRAQQMGGDRVELADA